MMLGLLKPKKFRGSQVVSPTSTAAMGAGDNRIYVVPSLALVVARQGRFAFERTAARSPFDNELWTRLMRAAPDQERTGP